MADVLPIAYLDGEFLPIGEARISPLDRGFLFGDAVYEVIPVYQGRPLLLDEHVTRLANSLDALQIDNPLPAADWRALIRELARRNGNGDLGVYLQITRGKTSGRDHAFPASAVPTVFGMASPAPAPKPEGLRAITMQDHRWGRCDIKATALLANVLARQAAVEAGADEAILLWNGEVTEGAASSVILIEQETMIRRPNSEAILPGTTTDLVVSLGAESGLDCQESVVTPERLYAANEIWLTSAMRGLAAVVNVDGRQVGDGRPGPMWNRVATRFEAFKHEQ